ncbi:PREDICTED: organic cation transporter protein-like, partial [Priapulus caudatus]|uniref:Organic cation transporter protein-like n=1 Tax=Priapulus caudatus TaxID=37621 RepID=A0ABM1F663_PRICU
MRALIRSVFMAGVMAGCIVMGMISDKFGRKKVIIVSCMANIAMSALVALSASYTMYITLRFLLGATCAGIYVVAYTLSMEFIGPSKRNVVGMSMSLPFTLAIALLSITGYFLTQWRAFQVAISLPLVPCLIATRFLDESARWLLVHKRKEEVIDIIETAAKMNKVVIPDAIYAETNNIEVSELTSQATLKDLLASRVILRLTLNLCCS